jgi:hypothetical protein
MPHLAESSGEGDEGAHQRNDPPNEDQHLPSTSEPRLSPVEVSMGNEHVLAEAIDERPTASCADEIPDVRPYEFRRRRDPNDKHEVERVDLATNSAAGQNPAENEGQLRSHRDSGRGDQAERKDREIAPGLEKVLHSEAGLA